MSKKYHKGISIPEVSRVLGLSVDVVRSLIARTGGCKIHGWKGSFVIYPSAVHYWVMNDLPTEKRHDALVRLGKAERVRVRLAPFAKRKQVPKKSQRRRVVRRPLPVVMTRREQERTQRADAEKVKRIDAELREARLRRSRTRESGDSLRREPGHSYDNLQLHPDERKKWSQHS